MASLRQFNLFNTLNKRVRTSGTVTLQVPGRYLYLQDGDDSLLALSNQTDPLQGGRPRGSGGFLPGNDGDNFLLREAVYRRMSSGGRNQTPVPLATLQTVNEDLDGLLVRIAEGTLLDDLKKPGETRLVIQGNGTIYLRPSWTKPGCPPRTAPAIQAASWP